MIEVRKERMTRSRKKTPIFGIANHNGIKWFKQYKHGQYELAETELAPWDEWDSPRDGQHYWNAPDDEYWRKMMRK